MMVRCITLLLSLVFAGAPVAADFCAASCEAAHVAAAASTGHAGHHHHHSSSASSTGRSSIGQAPRPCGHDHNGIKAVTPSSDAAHARPLPTAGAAVLPASRPAASLWASFSELHSSTSPPGPSVRGFASPLRV